MVNPGWKFFCQFLIMLNVYLSYNPAVPLLGIYPRVKNTCTRMFIVALVITVENWKQPNPFHSNR